VIPYHRRAMDGYVVTRPFPDSNVGSNLASLAGALWLARTVSRAVVVDWRGLSQLPRPDLNYFTEFFEAPPMLDGVEVAYAPDAAVGDYYPGSGAAWISPQEARSLGTGETTEAASHIVLQTYHGLDRVHPGPEPERLRQLRSFYRELEPGPEIRTKADSWWHEQTQGSGVIGVNIRTGNGHYFGKGGTYASRVDVSVFENRRRFLRVIEKACGQRVKSLPKERRENTVVFYATDAEWMSELLAELPNAVTRRSLYPPAGTGDTHGFSDDLAAARASIVDTLADMFLLARCDALIYNSSLFNQYARVLTGNFGGNQVHIETLFLRTRSRHLAAAARRRLSRVDRSG
jgi:hypothetical protein